MLTVHAITLSVARPLASSSVVIRRAIIRGSRMNCYSGHRGRKTSISRRSM